MPRTSLSLGPLLALLLLSGCTLFPEPAAPPRYYVLPVAHASGGGASGDGPRLRLRNVTAADHMDKRMIWRQGAFEVGYRDGHRWADEPTEYVWRSLMGELFVDRGLRRADSGAVPVLDVWLLAMEEIVGPLRQARVEIGISLVDADRSSLLTQSFQARADVRGDDMEAFVEAMGRALAQAADETGEAVAAAMR